VYFIFTDEEWNALFDEPSELLKVYCSIRRYMDINTGIAGIKRRFNEQYFKEVLDVQLIPGRHKTDFEKITRQKIRKILERLEKIGLLKRQKDFVFECVFALKGEVRSKEQEPSRNQNKNQSRNQEKHKKTQENKGFNEEQEPEQDTEHIASRNPPLISDQDINTNVFISNTCAFEEFWKIYPRKVSKKYAKKIWDKNKLDSIADIAIANVLKRLETGSWGDHRYIPHPATYLNQERWNDEINEEVKNNGYQERRPKSNTEQFWDETKRNLENAN